MIAVVTEEMHGSDRVADWKRLRASLRLERQHHPRERNGALLRVHAAVCSKSAWHGPTLLETRFINNNVFESAI